MPPQAAHAETVQKRQLLLRSEAVLQRQSARATRVLDSRSAGWNEAPQKNRNDRDIDAYAYSIIII